MNNTQKKVLWAGIVTIVLMAIFPPVRGTVFNGDSSGVNQLPGAIYYKFLLAVSPQSIQYARLFLQCFIVIIITSGLICAFKTAKRLDTKSQTGIKKGNPIQYPIDRIIYKDENKIE